MSVGADVEMVRPALADGGVYGVEGTAVPDRWTWRGGLAAQYERAPVQVLTEDAISSRPVSDRVGGWAGWSLGVGHRVAVHAIVPLSWQTGDDPLLSANGAGLGDPRVGARWGALDGEFLDATLRIDAFIPVGRRDAWMAEETARAAVGVSTALEGARGAVLLDAGLVIRPLEAPRPRFDWGPSAEIGLGARFDVLPTLSAGGAWVARAVLAGLDAKDGEVASELLASARYQATPAFALSAGGGAGLQGGVGVPTFRAFATADLTDTLRRRARAPQPVAAPAPPPPDPTRLLLEEIPGLSDTPPPPPPMARVEGEEIVFREEIRFAPESADLLPESRPVIVAIADVLAGDGRVAHLAIEGHASDAGDLVYNWDLSDRRARAVWEALILEGVSPERMSWRGMGVTGATDARPTENRRVVLRIARRLTRDEALPATPPAALLPWTGEAVALDTVSIPVLPPPPVDTIDPNLFKSEEEE